MYRIETKRHRRSALGFALICASAAGLFLLTTNVSANTEQGTAEAAYVDSVYSWGIWELGLEPASGPQPPGNTAMNDRSRKLKFRPNDNAAFIVQSIPVPSAIASPQRPQPPLSPIPASQPVAPPTIPIGPPGFSSGPPTTADPRN